MMMCEFPLSRFCGLFSPSMHNPLAPQMGRPDKDMVAHCCVFDTVSPSWRLLSSLYIYLQFALQPLAPLWRLLLSTRQSLPCSLRSAHPAPSWLGTLLTTLEKRVRLIGFGRTSQSWVVLFPAPTPEVLFR